MVYYAASLEADDTEYISFGNDASLQLAGDFSIGAWLRPETLPTGGGSKVIACKWDDAGGGSYPNAQFAISESTGSGVTDEIGTNDAAYEDVWLWIEMECDSTVGTYGTLYCRIYTDEWVTLAEELSLTLTQAVSFRYFYTLMGFNTGSAVDRLVSSYQNLMT